MRTMTLREFATRQILEVEAAANLFRLLRLNEGASNGRLQVLFEERKQSEKYARFLKGISWSEMRRELDQPCTFRESLITPATTKGD